ncbi:MAG TPA: 16S rRNA (cytosine(967)-C(5))-methyltransferase RsmB [Vicinamibacterales bacterium]|jgi:16S rRNA (cytosine967-C5)-methyltransferase|nr:16S rRNA (cytosine(967)-C(5))-methyltransferase RsmB [Vicinamibacterales bacterium]
MSPARWAAYQAVAAVGAGSDLATALARARTPLTDPRDRALAGEIALGVFRWLAALDYVIERLARRPAAKIEPIVLDILRVAVYQLTHLDRVPAAAVVNDAVDMARRAKRTGAAGFVNGVLRALGRRPPSLPPRPDPGRLGEPAMRAQALDYLSITLSHPRWLVERWLARTGFEAAEAWARFNNEPAPLTLRANTLRVDREELKSLLSAHDVECGDTRLATEGLIVRRGNPLLSPLTDRGLFLVQDEASQLVAEVLAVRSGERILDACASPGGKTVAIAAHAGADGLVVASDFRPRRIRLLVDTVRRTGADRVRIVRTDLRHPLPFGQAFDAVLVDAPCSGLGTIRRDPDIRWRRTEADVARLATETLTMLTHAAAVVRPGGRLVYATCSSEPEENEDVVSRFLENRPAFRQMNARTDASLLRTMGTLETVIDESGSLRTLPHVHALEAFFAVVLVHYGGAGLETGLS